MKRFYSFCALICFAFAAFSQALFNNNGAGIYVTDGGFMIVKTGSLYNNAGTGPQIISNQGTIVVEGDIQNNTSITGTGDTIKLQNNWINNGGYTGNNSLVDMYGNNQLIEGTAVTTFNNLQLDGAPGVVKAQAINAVTNGVLAINNTELATDSNTMLVTNPATTAITFNAGTGFISSAGAGRLAWVTNSTGNYVVPTGSPSSLGASVFRPVEIVPNGTGPDTFGFCLVKGNATADGYNINSVDTALCLVNPHFYHRLYRSGPDATALVMYFDQTADGDWTDEGHWKNNVWNYEGLATTGGGLGLSSVTVNNVNDFIPEPLALARKKFKLVAGPDLTIVDGQTAQFNPFIGAASGATIVWTPDKALSCESCPDPVASPATTMQYKITVTDPAGCSVSDSLSVTVVGNELLVPTGFSPNGDGMNDKFHILNKNLATLDLQVFNRWGELVYETEDPTVGWDGTYKSQKAEIGVYAWQCVYTLMGDPTTKIAKGNVTLIR